ncbi:hypothetical protein C6T71_06040 [Burkholderia multivorans]|nr:hypothetical protein C6T71_06040 [Burkholderia multivorans]
MACRRGAVGGAAGFDAASLGFGCPTKHPARRQAPLFDTQHCDGAARRARSCRACQRAARCASANGRAQRPASGLPSLVQAARGS